MRSHTWLRCCAPTPRGSTRAPCSICPVEERATEGSLPGAKKRPRPEAPSHPAMNRFAASALARRRAAPLLRAHRAHGVAHVPRNLKMHPERRFVAEEHGETNGGVGRDAAAAVDQLVYAAARHAERERELGLADRERFQEAALEKLTGVRRCTSRKRQARRTSPRGRSGASQARILHSVEHPDRPRRGPSPS